MMPGIGSLARRVTQLIRVYKKKAKFKSILIFRKCKMRRHMDRMRSMVLQKMDPYYSFGSLSS